MIITPNINDSNLQQVERVAWLAGYSEEQAGADYLAWLTATSGDYDIEGTGFNPAMDVLSHTEGAGAIDLQTPEKGYRETATKETWALGYGFSEEAWAALRPEIKARFLASFGASFGRRLLDSALEIVNDFEVTARGDGVPVVSASHPSNVGLQSNVIAAAFDFTSYAAQHLAMRQTRGPDGQRMGQTPRYLLGGANLGDDFFKVFSAGFQTDSLADPNYARSIMPESYGTSDRLDAADDWHLFSSQGKQSCQLHVRKAGVPKIEPIALTDGDIAVYAKSRSQRIVWQWRGIRSGGA